MHHLSGNVPENELLLPRLHPSDSLLETTGRKQHIRASGDDGTDTTFEYKTDPLHVVFFIPAQIVFLRCRGTPPPSPSHHCVPLRLGTEIFPGSSNTGCRSAAISTNANWVLMSWIKLRLCSTPRPAATKNRKVFPLHPCACMNNRECCSMFSRQVAAGETAYHRNRVEHHATAYTCT